MEDHDLIVIVTALASALGLKEIWQVIKKRMDLSAQKDANKAKRKENYETTKDQITAQVIEELKIKIGELESKKVSDMIKSKEKTKKALEKTLKSKKN